ncbi:MAG: DUF1674 domain-containing protein [Alphaproteobacteria bacterium]|nr:MAG: DUF1674 domain-containing protein [Alphaproteobacteria bacterium]
MSDKKAQEKTKDHAADALKEAEARRAIQKEKMAKEKRGNEGANEFADEFGGRDGPEATRYGDWEKNGITSDF